MGLRAGKTRPDPEHLINQARGSPGKGANMITNQTLIVFFLEWMNNYLTSGKMAEDLNLDRDDVQTLIHMGKKYLNRQHEG